MMSIVYLFVIVWGRVFGLDLNNFDLMLALFFTDIVGLPLFFIYFKDEILKGL